MENNHNISIARASPEDAFGIVDVFYKTWLDMYPNEEVGITKDDIVDKYKNAFTEEYLDGLKGKLRNVVSGNIYLVAKENETIVGVCRVKEHEHKNQLQAIYVLPEHQGKKIGWLLWQKAGTFFNPNKDTFVEVATYNEKAVAFYSKLGFVDTGRRFKDEKFIMKSGACIPEMEMKLQISK